jgi:hypothetical protein
MYSGDLKFSSIAAEIIYSTAKLDDSIFVNWCASHYFSNRRNQIFHEMLEINYNKFLEGAEFSRLEGRVEIVGKKSKQDVVMFSPMEFEETVKTKVYRKNAFYEGNINSMFKEGEFVLLMTRKNTMSKIEEHLYEEQYQERGDQGIKKHQTTLELVGRNFELLKRMGITNLGEMSCVMAFISEISANNKLKLYVLFDDSNSKYLDFPEQTWYLVRSNSHYVPNYTKINESLKQFTTKISMNPSLQLVVLSTPMSNISFLNKLIRSSAISMNPNNSDTIKNILVTLEEKMNMPQLEAVKSSLFANLTIVQTPSGTNKLLTIVEIVKSWIIYSPAPVLVYSKNKTNIDLIHMALLKTSSASLCLNDEIINGEFVYEDPHEAFNWICKNNYNLNPFNIKYETMKSIMDQFKVICCTTNEILSENLKSKPPLTPDYTFTRILVDDSNQLTEVELIPAIIKNCQQLVLLGDDKQLPPSNLSVMAKSKGLGLSLFEKLMKQRIKPIFFHIQYCKKFLTQVFTPPSSTSPPIASISAKSQAESKRTAFLPSKDSNGRTRTST